MHFDWFIFSTAKMKAAIQIWLCHLTYFLLCCVIGIIERKKKKLELIKFKTKAAAQDSNFFKINFFD